MRPRRLPDLLALGASLLPAVDVVIVCASAFVAGALAHLRDAPPLLPFANHYQIAVIFACLLCPLVFNYFTLYRSHRGENLPVELVQLTIGWFVVLGALTLIAAATKTTSNFSRVWMLTWLGLGMGLFWLHRIVLRIGVSYLRARGWDTRDIVLIGAGEEAARVVTRLSGLRGSGYRVAGYFSDSELRKPEFATLRYLGGYDRIVEALVGLDKPPDQVWIALPAAQSSALAGLVAQLSRTTLDCRLVPDIVAYNILNHTVTQIGGLPVIDLSRSPMTGLNRIIKALEDRLLAAGILLLMSPLMLLIAMLIRLDSPGPVIFRQRRHGWNGEEIIVFKFRTMTPHYEAEGQVTQASPDDVRVTRIGRYLRRTSLDELPQFFNVLLGTMSVVGPRPHAVEHNEHYKELIGRYILRHKVKPGITGWAQVNGFRGQTETVDMMRQRIEYDLYYIEHWSVWFDLIIVVLTVVKGLVSQRAY